MSDLPLEASAASLPALLEQAVALLADDAQPLAPQRVRLAGLRERWAAGRFHLAGLGQFNRGKSTLLTALVG